MDLKTSRGGNLTVILSAAKNLNVSDRYRDSSLRFAPLGMTSNKKIS
jgi:hypothetical protein